MGGRGKGVSVSAIAGEGLAQVAVTFNPDSPSRPFSIQGKTADGQDAAWALDARGRPRTFATEEAAVSAASSASSEPVYVHRFERGSASSLSSSPPLSDSSSSAEIPVILRPLLGMSRDYALRDWHDIVRNTRATYSRRASQEGDPRAFGVVAGLAGGEFKDAYKDARDSIGKTRAAKSEFQSGFAYGKSLLDHMPE